VKENHCDVTSCAAKHARGSFTAEIVVFRETFVFIIHAPINICCNEDKILRFELYSIFITYNVSALDIESSNIPWRIY